MCVCGADTVESLDHFALSKTLHVNVHKTSVTETKNGNHEQNTWKDDRNSWNIVLAALVTNRNNSMYAHVISRITCTLLFTRLLYHVINEKVAVSEMSKVGIILCLYMNDKIYSTRKNAETKREEFRKYLETNGILDALTKVLVGLYEEPEKPMDPLEYPFYFVHVNASRPMHLYDCKEQNKFLKMFDVWHTGLMTLFYDQNWSFRNLSGRFLNSTLRFVKRHLHGGPPDVVDVDALQQRVRELEEQNKRLESELALVKQQVCTHNSVTAGKSVWLFSHKMFAIFINYLALSCL